MLWTWLVLSQPAQACPSCSGIDILAQMSSELCEVLSMDSNCWGELSRAGGATVASSELTEGRLVHAASRLSDQDLATAWCEGVDGDGLDQRLTMKWSTPRPVVALEIWGGYALDERRMFNNNRVQAYRISLDDRPPVVFAFEDYVRGEAKAFPPHIIKLAEQTTPISVSTMKIEVLSVYRGDKYQDTCIAEVHVWQRER